MAQISVFIPLFNAEKFIVQSIESVLAQTFTDWELLVLDDNSTDKSYEVAKNYEAKDGRIKVEKNPANLGMVANWNKGINNCHSEFFVKLDADDYWHPEMLKGSLKILTTYQEVGLVFTRYQNIDEKGNEIPGTEMILPDFAKNKSFSCVPLVQSGADKMLSYPILRQGVSLIRRKIFDELGDYRYLLSKETQAASDTEFYFRVGCHYQIYCIDQIYYFYRIHSSSISSTDAQDDLGAKKIFESKQAIVDYYFSQQQIDSRTKRNFQKQIHFEYNTYGIYSRRKKRYYWKMLGLLFQNFRMDPFRFFSFYFNRIMNR